MRPNKKSYYLSGIVAAVFIIGVFALYNVSLNTVVGNINSRQNENLMSGVANTASGQQVNTLTVDYYAVTPQHITLQSGRSTVIPVDVFAPLDRSESLHITTKLHTTTKMPTQVATTSVSGNHVITLPISINPATSSIEGFKATLDKPTIDLTATTSTGIAQRATANLTISTSQNVQPGTYVIEIGLDGLSGNSSFRNLYVEVQ